MGSAVVLEVHDLQVTFRTGGGLAPVVSGVDFSVAPGKTLAIVGESGSGKSVCSAAVMGLLPSNADVKGEILLSGRELNGLAEDELRRIRGKDIAVFQDALSALNPYYSVGWQIAEAYRLHKNVSKKEAWKRAIETLYLVGIPSAATCAKSYPHEFSGGMRLRVVIAMALVNNPKVLIADEPTKALDVTVQAQILRLLEDVQAEFGTALVLLSRDLGVVAEVADDILVMYAGHATEVGTVRDLFHRAAHPYSLGLLGATPRADVPRRGRLATIPGELPSAGSIETACPFQPRCAYTDRVGERCITERPALTPRPGEGDHEAACHLGRRPEM
ncbi:peptide/nickel transport system ATP-binding protein [Kribbella sp. VKM Ac-2527]|uniref:Peptide/nickel transport system ATP-binding protein n=1 Tax=Kribbella caucasensis TaxID=2512215 RepID=A0A4R6K859_9ACTN|nr:ABC transporter ATP-binding protein [Kribbella sp. VKM Ac-2527]TDO45274.1 peptide/nickel transport system ATP-binding protein [Kribbella sp. VKM Ac-2527]